MNEGCSRKGIGHINRNCSEKGSSYKKEVGDTKKYEQLDRNMIAVDARMQARYVIIRVTNYGSLAAKKQEGHKTGSRIEYDSRGTGHGYGRGIVEEIAAIYHGEFFLEEHYGIVEALLILQI